MISSLQRFLFAFAAVFMLTALASCSDDSPVAPVEKKPLLSGPGSVNFGAVSSGSCKDTTIRYDNTTGKAVTITATTLTGTSFTWVGATFPLEVAAGASIDLRVRFCPTSMDTARSTLVFKSSNDSIKVSLVGFSNDVTPQPGSRYIYDTHALDENGNKVEGSEGTQTDIITAVNTTYKGKSNVFIVSEDGALSYYAKESNGDISVYLDPASGGPFGSLVAGWKRLPYGSKQQNVELLRKDTTMTVEGAPAPVTVTITQIASYAGQTSMVVGGKTMTVDNVTFTTKLDISMLGFPIGSITNIVKGGYIYAISYQGRFETTLTSTIPEAILPIPQGGSVKTLTSFVIE